MTLPRKPHKDNPFSSFAPPTEIKLKRTELKRTKGLRLMSAKKRKELREGLRDRFAAAALTGCCANPNYGSELTEDIVERASILADEMMEAREL